MYFTTFFCYRQIRAISYTIGLYCNSCDCSCMCCGNNNNCGNNNCGGSVLLAETTSDEKVSCQLKVHLITSN